MPPAKKRASDRNVMVSMTYCCTARNGKDANTARLDSHTSNVKNVMFGCA